MKVFDTIDEVAKAPEEKLAQVDGIGPKLAKTIKDYFNSNNEKN
jgi:NAD-dependent DNA ligase